MKSESERAESATWWPDNEDGVLAAYIGAHYEFSFEFETGRPYRRKWNDVFRSVPGAAAWRLKHDGIANNLTADLIAVVEVLSLPTCCEEYGGGFRSYLEGMRAWMPFLDGGLYVNFTMWEKESNALAATQTTCISGFMAFQYCLVELGFELPKRRLKGQVARVAEDEIQNLLERQSTPGTAESREVAKKARWATVDELVTMLST